MQPNQGRAERGWRHREDVKGAGAPSRQTERSGPELVIHKASPRQGEEAEAAGLGMLGVEVRRDIEVLRFGMEIAKLEDLERVRAHLGKMTVVGNDVTGRFQLAISH
ncbi:MAG: hypothetical protein M1815_001599 [Lichina confinis]|nr:MAG: hypothetical protein M1815_001599 [Lichina confinis]